MQPREGDRTDPATGLGALRGPVLEALDAYEAQLRAFLCPTDAGVGLLQQEERLETGLTAARRAFQEVLESSLGPGPPDP